MNPFQVNMGHSLPFNTVPPGTIIPYAGKVKNTDWQPTDQDQYGIIPELWGWTLCDGRFLDPSEYPSLFQVLGYLYGSQQNNSTILFGLPDYRGYFLRGVDLPGSIDKDVNTRVLPTNSDSSDAHGIASIQQSALQTHVHTDNEPNAPIEVNSGNQAAVASNKAGKTEAPEQDPAASTNLIVSQYESRPINVAVYYLIKFM